MGSGLKEGGLQSRNAEGLYPRGRHWAQLVLLSEDLYLRFIPGALFQVLPLLQSVSEFLPNKDEFLKNYKCPCVTDMFSDLPCLLKNPNQTNQITKTSKQTGQSVVKQIWFLWFWPDCREGKPSILCLACITVYRKGDRGAWKYTEHFRCFSCYIPGPFQGLISLIKESKNGQKHEHNLIRVWKKTVVQGSSKAAAWSGGGKSRVFKLAWRSDTWLTSDHGAGRET